MDTSHKQLIWTGIVAVILAFVALQHTDPRSARLSEITPESVMTGNPLLDEARLPSSDSAPTPATSDEQAVRPSSHLSK